MGGIGWFELIIVFGLVLLLFGAKRIPELARSLGRAKREFQNELTGKNSTTSSVQEDITCGQQKEASDNSTLLSSASNEE